MSSLVGFLSLVFAIGINVYLFLSRYIFKFQKQKFNLFIRFSSLLTLLSFFSLMYAYVISDFSNYNVFQNSHSDKPLIYKISGTWGNHEGSILLWLLVMTFFGFLFSIQNIKNKDIKIKTLYVQNTLIFLIGLFIVLTSNPFERSFPPEIEGSDLNPLLQDPGLIIHPPLLYLGYVGFSIVYSISLAVLLFKIKKDDFVNVLRPWVFASWTFLTLGIGLGSWWAYYELGWGGFWFWDPVENASLLPWLGLQHQLFFTQFLFLVKENYF